MKAAVGAAVGALLAGSAAAAPARGPTVAERLKADLAKKDDKTTHWALLMAGSNTWGNYRHQADTYHAYQIFKAAGLDDDHIVVMHYDDIANGSENPMPGKVINKPDGDDVYAGVPKDYTGCDVNADNFVAILKGDADSVSGGSGKVIDSSADDKVFVAFFDHGGPGILGVPGGCGDFLYANDVNKALTDKFAANGFKELTFYVEACESGSIFEGLLPANISTYVTTAANADESSWGYYCPGMTPAPPSEFNTCLGDFYSITWMENADSADLSVETLEKQYKVVRDIVGKNGTYDQGSHVMQYGDTDISNETVSEFIPAAKDASEAYDWMQWIPASARKWIKAEPKAAVKNAAVEQRDADLHSLWHVYLSKPAGSDAKAKAFKAFQAETNRRAELDAAVANVAAALLSEDQLNGERKAGEPVTRDWDCYKQGVKAFEAQCGALGQYGLKHAGVMAKACNAGKTPADITVAAGKACVGVAL